jgi:hypothetical protein
MYVVAVSRIQEDGTEINIRTISVRTTTYNIQDLARFEPGVYTWGIEAVRLNSTSGQIQERGSVGVRRFTINP